MFYDPATESWWKRNTLNFHDGSISAYLERLAIQKFLFPELAPHFVGFTTYKGELLPVISQPHAKGTEPSDIEVAGHLKSLGFREVTGTGKGMGKAHELAVQAGLNPPPLAAPERVGFYQPSLGIWLEDVHGENAVKTPHGIGVFDPVAYFVNKDALNAKLGIDESLKNKTESPSS